MSDLANMGFISVLPAVIAIVLSFVTKNTIVSLVIACIIPVFFLVVWKCRKSMQDASIKVKQRTATINADIESGLSGGVACFRSPHSMLNSSVQAQGHGQALLLDLPSRGKFGRRRCRARNSCGPLACLSVIQICTMATCRSSLSTDDPTNSRQPTT